MNWEDYHNNTVTDGVLIDKLAKNGITHPELIKCCQEYAIDIATDKYYLELIIEWLLETKF